MAELRVDFARVLVVGVVAVVAWAPSAAWADFCSGKQSGLWCDGSKLVTCSGGKVAKSVTCSAGCQSMPPGTPDKCKSGGFCSGKQNGLWCDGNKLVNCANGSVSSSKTCSNGCQSMPAGTADQCKAATNFCTGKASGKWCDGSKLVTCKSGQISGSQSCANGCQSMPAGTNDQCKAATNFCTGKASGKWCDGSKLVTCKSGQISGSQSCASGCQSMPAGTNDQCKAATNFCTGKASGKWCDGSKLVTCKSGQISGSQSCANGCQSMPAGTDDQCKGAAGGFCTGKASGKWCDGNKLVTCKSGAVSASQVCAQGCQSNPPGVADACKGSGGGGLVLCAPFKPSKAVTCGFGCYSGHKGSDYAASQGTPVYAPMGGQAVSVKKSVPGQTCSPDFGNFVKIKSGDWEVILAHMGQDIPLSQGQTVKAGELVGKVSNTGYTLAFKGGQWVCKQGGGHHLHLELRHKGTPVNAFSTGGVSWTNDCGQAGSGGGTQPGDSFCVGKQSGAWCEGQALVTCKSGAMVASKACDYGCQSNAVGTPDVCKPPPAGFCTGKADGAWCQGESLVQCKGGTALGATACKVGCESMPAGVADQCKAPKTWCTGKSDGQHCQGDTLTLCAAGKIGAEQVCPAGCDSGQAACKPAAPKGFCAGKVDGLWCDGGDLRTCGAGASQGVVGCAFGCQSGGAAAPDSCKPDPKAVDPCAARADGPWCQGDLLRVCKGGVTATQTPCSQGCGGTPPACGASGDFCAGKVSGVWCKGVALVTCQANKTVATSVCAFGCASAGAGQPDLCLPAAAALCAAPPVGKGDGAWCQGDVRVTCLAGKLTAQVLCAKGCSSNGAVGVASCQASAGLCQDKVGGAWCNGGTLVSCLQGAAVAQTACKFGCTATPGAAPDHCTDPGAGGEVCTGHPDGALCDGDQRVHCAGGQEQGRTLCAYGCVGDPGSATCASSDATVCAGAADGPRCVGATVVTCASGAVAGEQSCPNGCTSAGACVLVGMATDPGATVVVDAEGCARLAGAVSLTVAPQDQRPVSETLGACVGRTVAEDGALVATLSTLYATFGLPRSALGLSGNTPALENVWRNQHDGYAACPGELGACCARWDANPGDVHLSGRSLADPACWSVATATAIAASLNAGLPVVAAVHSPGEAPASHWVLIMGLESGAVRIADPWGGVLTTLAAGARGAYVVDGVALPTRDGDLARTALAGDPLPGGPGALAGRVAPDAWADAGGVPGGAPPVNGGCAVQRVASDLPWHWLLALLAAVGWRRARQSEPSRGGRAR